MNTAQLCTIRGRRCRTPRRRRHSGPNPCHHIRWRTSATLIFGWSAWRSNAEQFPRGSSSSGGRPLWLHFLPMPTKAFAAQSATSPLGAHSIKRRDPLPTDVAIDILYCGVCHSDLHFARNEWGFTQYPCVPGHEILGRVTKVGDKVKKFKVGDIAAVGCLVDSCRSCTSCKNNLEQFCLNGPVFTYNGEDKHLGGITYGGYSENVVVDEAFALKV